MYAEASEKKMSTARVSFALLCGLAVCCSVMYITADAGDDYIHEIVAGKDAGTSVGSTDVMKAGQIYTETPDGRMRLMDYFNNVEKEIADEVANRKSDIASVRAQMARDFAFNAAARSKLKKEMLHKMAQNAKIARDNLNTAMRHTQERFAKAANLANRRYKATNKRDKETSEAIAADKKEAAEQLSMAVSAWQKSTSAWASATNARINRMNKHVAANAAQIKENAKKARKDLEVTMEAWDHSVNNFREDSKNARSKLSEQFAEQDKATRAWANNKIKAYVASTASQFNDVETKMAKHRHEIDAALKQATMRFEASLNAAKALEDHRYAQTVSDIAAAKKEAADKVDEASSEFKVSLLALSSTVAQQVATVNGRIDETADVVRSDAAAQAKVNANVNAEMARMIELGNNRYKEQLKNDVELQTLIDQDKAETDEKMNQMANEFNQALSDIRAQLQKDRQDNEDALTTQTNAVWSKLWAQQDAQQQKNADMKAETRRVRLDAMDAIRKAKQDFRKSISDLGEVVAANDEKADKAIEKLTGVVVDEAAKSKKGREELAMLEEANKQELKKSVKDAIRKGEERAKGIEKEGEKMDADTRFLINTKLSQEISTLRDETDASVEQLALLNKENREQMKKEMLYAIRTAAEVAADDLQIAVKEAEKKMVAFEKKAAASHASSEEKRKELADAVEANALEVSRMITLAVDTDARAQTLLRTETAAAIKATNTNLDAHAAQMRKNAEDARAEIKAQTAATMDRLKAKAEADQAALEEFNSEDAARQTQAMKFLEEQLEAAGKAADQKFGKAYERLADDRKHADEQLGTAVEGLNDSLAKQAALADSRFRNTVKDIAAARKQASDQVNQFRKDFAVQITSVTAQVSNIAKDLNSQIGVVSGEFISYKALQAQVNEDIANELKFVENLSNKRFSESTKARGKLRMLMDENKQAAAAEVAALQAELETEISDMRHTNNENKKAMAKDLSDATELFYEKLTEQQRLHNEQTTALDAETAAAAAASQGALEHAQANFDSKILMLTNTVAANAEHAENEMARITGVVHDYAKAAASDRELIKEETKVMETDLNSALKRAIRIGETKAKAVAQRVANHLKDTKRFLQVELAEQVDAAADLVFKTLSEKRHHIADNYLSLKAYAVSAADEVEDYIDNGKGRGLSAIGDLLVTVGAMGAVHAPETEGLGMGGDAVPTIFTGESISVPGAVAEINGLVNEFTSCAKQVRERWPMGLGKYLMDKLEVSMADKGVLQVDKVEGKSGNFVFMNGHSVGLSNKLSDFAELASRMSTYESVLAKMTAKLTVGPSTKGEKIQAPPPVWPGN